MRRAARRSVTAGSSRLEIETRLEWRGRRTLIRARFPFALRSHEAWFETTFGAVPRPTHRNTPWDHARYEVPAQRFAVIAEPDYAAALLNDGKSGHSAEGGELGLTLHRAPIYPDPYADEGEHRFTYAIAACGGDWRARLKRAEDGEGFVLRVYEPGGRRGVATLSTSFAMAKVCVADLLETRSGAAIEGPPYGFAYRPFGVVTLRLDGTTR